MSLIPIQTVGGLDAAWNIDLAQLTAPASYQPSGFYPANQRIDVENINIPPATGLGFDVVPLDPGIPSINETLAMSMNNWIGSPYEIVFGPPVVKAKESTGLASMISDASEKIKGIYEPLEKGLSWATDVKTKITNLWDVFSGDYEARAPVPYGSSQAQEGTASETHYNDMTDMAASVYRAGAGMIEQVKGLFSRGYPQSESQGTAGITSELSRGAGLSIVTIIIIVLLAILLWKK